MCIIKTWYRSFWQVVTNQFVQIKVKSVMDRHFLVSMK